MCNRGDSLSRKTLIDDFTGWCIFVAVPSSSVWKKDLWCSKSNNLLLVTMAKVKIWQSFRCSCLYRNVFHSPARYGYIHQKLGENVSNFVLSSQGSVSHRDRWTFSGYSQVWYLRVTRVKWVSPLVISETSISSDIKIQSRKNHNNVYYCGLARSHQWVCNIWRWWDTTSPRDVGNRSSKKCFIPRAYLLSNPTCLEFYQAAHRV